ncbi:MAG: hypothetical protein ABIL39_08890 [candidate division WOR-3 bacterium]
MFRYVKIVLVIIIFGCEHKKFFNPHDPANLPPPPELLYPEDNSIFMDNPPFFQWDLKEDSLNPFYGGDITFELQVNTNSDFNGAPSFSCITSYCIYLPVKLFGDSTYYWRVRAKYNETDWGEWSKVNRFRVRFPAVGTLSIPHYNDDMILHLNYAFIAHLPGLYVIDITNPSNPQMVCFYSDTISQFSKIAIKEYNLYAIGGYKLGEYDMHNVSSPLPKRYLTLPYSARDLVLWGNFIYATTWAQTYKINAVDPDSLYIVDSFSCSGSLIDVKDNYLFILDAVILYIIELTTNNISTRHLPGTASSLWFSENYCFIAGNKVWVYDITEPLNPILVTTIDKSAYTISASGRYLFFSTYDYQYQINVLCIYDVSNISNPQYLATIKYCGGLIGTDGNFIYLTEQAFYVIKYE